MPCNSSICGENAKCHMGNNSLMCVCLNGYVGDPYLKCTEERYHLGVSGTFSTLRQQSDAVVCKCLPGYVGDPYLCCHPECARNSSCALNRACIRNKCIDPCPGLCGTNAECVMNNHAPICSCQEEHTGNPYSSCSLIAVKQS